MKTKPNACAESSERARQWHEEHRGVTHKQLNVLLTIETYNRLNTMRGDKSWPKFLKGLL